MILLFDLDDTLYPERLYIYQGLWNVSKNIEDSPDAVKNYILLLKLFKQKKEKIFDEFIKLTNSKEDPLRLLNFYRKCNRILYLYPEVKDVLLGLKRKGHTLLLLTNGRREDQEKKIRLLHLDKILHEIYILDKYGRNYWKPSTLIMKDEIYKKYPGLYLFIGNGEDDLEFAKEAKIKFVFIDRKDAIRKINDERDIYYKIKNLRELTKIIKENKNENTPFKTVDHRG